MNKIASMSCLTAGEKHLPQGHEPTRAPLAKFDDLQLLSALIATDKPADNAINLASRFLDNSGGLRPLLDTAESTSQIEDSGYSMDERLWLDRLRIFGEIFTRALREETRRGKTLSSPSDTLDYLQRSLRDRRREIFHCVFLDTRHRVLNREDLFQGSIDGACVYPRVVAEHALRYNAAAVIVAHNHPSGMTEPSLADQAITRRLKDALDLLEIRLLDHFIIGDGTPVSMAARGML